jgi:plastocyanin
MKRIYALLAAATVALATTAAATPMAPPKVTGTVGPGFTISLKRGLAPVRTLKAGRYTFVVSDKAAIHNFQVEGPGLDRAITAVGFVGTKTVTLLLKRGTYKFYCKPHESSMHGSFRVT